MGYLFYRHCPLGDLLDPENPSDIPVDIIPVEFDFQMAKAVPWDPLLQSFGKTIAHRLDHLGMVEGIKRPDQVIEWQTGFGQGFELVIQTNSTIFRS